MPTNSRTRSDLSPLRLGTGSTLAGVHPVSVSRPESEAHLAMTDAFSLEIREPLAYGLRRVTVDQFDVALEALRSQPDDLAVHEIRKATKRLRAVLRLVRPSLGDRYRAEDAILRDTARVLSPYRDAHVRAVTLEGIRERFDAQLRPSAFEDIAYRLLHLRDRQFAAPGEDFRTVSYALRSARARYAAWPIDEASAKAYGMAVIRHRFSSVESGVTSIYARSRDEMRTAQRHPSADNFHSWRKEAKYLRHQLEILSPLFPEVVGGYAASLARLGDLLGEEHDLAELLRFLAAHRDVAPESRERALLVALIQHRRAELQSTSLSLGSRIHTESPARFVGRLAHYWHEWDAPIPVGFSE